MPGTECYEECCDCCPCVDCMDLNGRHEMCQATSCWPSCGGGTPCILNGCTYLKTIESCNCSIGLEYVSNAFGVGGCFAAGFRVNAGFNCGTHPNNVFYTCRITCGLAWNIFGSYVCSNHPCCISVAEGSCDRNPGIFFMDGMIVNCCNKFSNTILIPTTFSLCSHPGLQVCDVSNVEMGLITCCGSVSETEEKCPFPCSQCGDPNVVFPYRCGDGCGCNCRGDGEGGPYPCNPNGQGPISIKNRCMSINIDFITRCPLMTIMQNQIMFKRKDIVDYVNNYQEKVTKEMPKFVSYQKDKIKLLLEMHKKNKSIDRQNIELKLIEEKLIDMGKLFAPNKVNALLNEIPQHIAADFLDEQDKTEFDEIYYTKRSGYNLKTILDNFIMKTIQESVKNADSGLYKEITDLMKESYYKNEELRTSRMEAMQLTTDLMNSPTLKQVRSCNCPQQRKAVTKRNKKIF